jgi:peptidoglycan/LPS O-acetylase OafA/YrhL
MSNSPADNRLYTLDAMRGLAAIIVLAWHFPELHPYIGNGYLAVDFFFALSGLVVAKAYEAKLASGLGSWTFIKLRFVRLYPMYVLGFSLGMLASVAKIFADHLPASEIFALARPAALNLAMVPAFGSSSLFPINSPSWSLFFEMAINVVFCLWLTRRSAQTLMVVALVSGVALAAFGLQNGHLDIGWNWKTFPAGFARVTYGFTIGMLIWRSGFASAPSSRWISLLVVAILVAALIAPTPEPYKAISSIVMAIAVLPGLVALGARWQLPSGGEAPAEALGDLSYPLYAIHKPMVVTTAIPRMLGFPTPLWVIPFILGLLIASWVLGRFIDPILRKWLGSLLSRLRIDGGLLKAR